MSIAYNTTKIIIKLTYLPLFLVTLENVEGSIFVNGDANKEEKKIKR